MAACHESGVAVVPRGGATGLVDGTLCQPDEITLSTERMTGIEPVDPLGMTVVVGTGATIESVQEAASAAGLFFPWTSAPAARRPSAARSRPMPGACASCATA